MNSTQNFPKNGILLIFLLLVPMSFYAQTPVNFSGKWQYDKSKSIPDKLTTEYDGTIVLEIIQNNATVSFAEIYIHPERPEWKTSADVYSLDGKEKTTKSDAGTSRKKAEWSPDKKVLKVTNIDTQTDKGVTKDYVVIDTYSLSDDGKTLTVERYRKNAVTGETKGKMVYFRK